MVDWRPLLGTIPPISNEDWLDVQDDDLDSISDLIDIVKNINNLQ